MRLYLQITLLVAVVNNHLTPTVPRVRENVLRHRRQTDEQIREGEDPPLVDDSFMSPPRPIQEGQKAEPVIFEPEPRIRVSRSTYKVYSYIDFQTYIDSFKRLGTYLHSFYDNVYRYNLQVNRGHGIYRDCKGCLLYTSPSPRDATLSRMPSSA